VYDRQKSLPHAHDQMNIRAHQFRIRRIEIRFCWRLTGILNYRFHFSVDVVEFIWLVDVRNVTSIQDIIEIFKEGFIFNLSKITTK
jgi:hypothetical protein